VHTGGRSRSDDISALSAQLQSLVLCDIVPDWCNFQEKDPIARQVEVAELAAFAKLIFTIVVNQAGCGRTFSDVKIKQTHRQNRLGLNKLEKMTEVGSNIKLEHQTLKLAKMPGKRQVHKSTDTLLAVPWYSIF